MSESDGRWYKSSYSGGDGGGCVEVQRGPQEIRVRDSKDPDSPVLTFNRREWQAFLQGVSDGQFDLLDLKKR